MKKELTPRTIRLAIVALVVLVALGQRVSAARSLPVDADEPVYAWSAAYYAHLMARGEWAEIPQVTTTAEHPVFVRLLYALGLRAAGYAGPPDMPASPTQTDLLWQWGDDQETLGVFMVDRIISVVFGTLQVLVVALVNPLAGAALAIHTMTAKYTAQIYLEAVPAFAITAAFLAYDRARKRGDGETGAWFWLSAAMLGLTAASKYTYAAVGFAMVPFIVWQQRCKPWNIALYGALALAVFLALNPILWPAPVERLLYSLRYHQSYTESVEVARYDYGWWQPLAWMSGAGSWHPGVFWFPFDILIFLASLVGLWFLRRQNNLFTAWYVTGWLILFLWPTKWPQYTLIVTPALCLSLGAIGQAVVERFDLRLDRETWERIAFYLPDHTFWIAPPKGLIIAVAAMIALYGLGYAAFRINRVRQMRGWETVTTSGGELVGDTVTALALDAEGHVWVGTRSGVSIYAGAEHSTLPIPQVTVLTAGDEGNMWVGTESGVVHVRDGVWVTTTAEAMGLAEARVRAIDIDPAGYVWVGTRTGAALWDGTTWRAFSPDEGGLSSDAVLALAVDAQDRAWIGTDSGLAILDISGAEPLWTTYTAFGSELPANSVRALKAQGNGMWIGTGGGGLCFWQAGGWACYRTGNSDIPWNTIAALELDSAGRIWSATEQPAQSGGAVAVFDGEDWRSYTSRNSGLATGQVTAILEDAQGRFWFGTYGAGVSIYDP
jgi:ligand-binding sensor domain-containing protein